MPDVLPATTVEVARTARLMRVDADALEYLARFDASEIRSLRLAVHTRIRADNAHRFKRLAMLGGLLPRKMTAVLAQRSMSPRLAAGVVEALPPEQAADVAGRMAPAYLAKTCEYLPAGVATPIVVHLSDEKLLAVCDVMVEQEARSAMAEMIESLSDEQLVTFMERIDDPGTLLDISAVVTADGQLERVATLVPDDLLSRIIRHAVDSVAHWDLALALLALLPASERKRLLAVVAASGRPPEA
ncbi:hypothetical protein [Solicola gregarius]|uniref:Magnesium transporter MgtE intracellular domain-containing protein n=1 Tax=Solicola gregarius TaxID=2908642 RepID=A0AA46YMV1_9ACTN|nr:hypothetical protein [Solicola gregarius]UYM06851.1 hypothetical protein L0C25_07180 [Solicola gregarius]